MANTPFIQFPCGEWVPGYGPEDAPCDPLIDGDCDDPDIRHPTCAGCPVGPPGGEEGWHCNESTGNCYFGPTAGYDTYEECMVACEDTEPPPPPPPPPPPGTDPGGPGVTPGEGDEVFIELCPCETEGEAGGGCIKQVGAEKVARWVEMKENGCKVVILGGLEGEAGGGCETTLILIEHSQGPIPYSCTVCPCWEIGDPQEGDPLCKEPDQGDGTASGVIRGVTENINAGTHCPEDLEVVCCPEGCDDECDPSFTGPNPNACPGCKPFDTDAGDDDDDGDGDGECKCEVNKLSEAGGPGGGARYEFKVLGDQGMQPTCEAVSCEGVGRPTFPAGGAFGPPEQEEEEECECCECKIEVEFPQDCKEPEDLVEGEDGGGGAAALFIMNVLNDQNAVMPCPKCEGLKDYEPDECECPIDLESGWKKEPGGTCECPEEPEEDSHGTLRPTPEGQGGGEDEEEEPCPPAVWQICWKEKCCTESDVPGAITPGGPGGPGGPPTPGTGGGGPGEKCKCVIDDIITQPATEGDNKCPDDCCEEPCEEGQECKGVQKRLTIKYRCKQGESDMGDEWCGCEIPQDQDCECPKKTLNPATGGDDADPGAAEGCPQQGAHANPIHCYKNCKCEGGEGGNVDDQGPCDDVTLGEGSTGSTGNTAGLTSNAAGGQKGSSVGARGGGGRAGGTGNHEVGGNTSEWVGSGKVEYLHTDPNTSSARKESNAPKRGGVPYSQALNSEFQVNIKAIANAAGARKAYGNDFNFSVRKSTHVRKNRGVVSREVEIKSEEFLQAQRNSRFTRTTETPREKRTTNSLYNDNLTLYKDIPTPRREELHANSYNLEIFAERVRRPVYSHLKALTQEQITWDESIIEGLTLDNIRRSLSTRCRGIAKTLKNNPQFGLNHFDFYKIIREHLLRNTLNELDLSFYETFVSKQAKIPRFVVRGRDDNERLAVQMAISYARTAYPVDAEQGLTNQYSTLYRAKYSDLASRIPVDRDCGEPFFKLTAGDTIPIICEDGTTNSYSFGSLSATEGTLAVVGQGNCDNTVPLTQETTHAVRLNNKVRDKILKLLGVQHSEQIASETNKSLEVELTYSLTDLRDEYYFFAADYSTTQQNDNYNNSEYLVQFNRDYTRVTDTDQINDIIKNQVGATHYIASDDRLLDHAIESNTLKYRWIDFSLQSFGLDDVESFPVFIAKNPAYIIVIPTALSENNPFHSFSDLYIAGDIVGRKVKLALHLDAQKLEKVVGTQSDAIKVERDES